MFVVALALAAAAPAEPRPVPQPVTATATVQVEIIRLERVVFDAVPEARPLLRQVDRREHRVDFYEPGFQPISATRAERGTSVTASFTVTLSPGARADFGARTSHV